MGTSGLGTVEKIPSEMEVALHYTLLTLFSLFREAVKRIGKFLGICP